MKTNAELSRRTAAKVASGRPTAVRLMSSSGAGHRAAYDLVLIRLLQQHGVELRPDVCARAVLFPMLDDNIAGFARTALSNAIVGRRTVGLFFRPAEALKRNRLRYWLKYALFRVLKMIPGTRILTIMPFYLEPRFAEVAHDWIYDLQFWDIHFLQPEHSSARVRMADAIRHESRGRRVVMALGGQGRDKGFDFFVQLQKADPLIRKQFLFVAAGQVAPDCAGLAEDFTAAGGLLIDRYVSDDELFGLYDATDLVWSCYAASYNQASGVFGRALQFGRASIVRRSAYIHHLGMRLGSLMLDLDPEETLDKSIKRLIDWPFETNGASRDSDALRHAAIEMREKSSATLIAALGISP